MLKLYCDLDGVLVDFEKGVWRTIQAVDSLKALGKSYKEITSEEVQEVLKTVPTDPTRTEIVALMQNMPSKRLWPAVGKNKSFWLDLEWMPDGRALWNYIKAYHPTVLTGVSMDKNCAHYKNIWVKRELGDHVDVITCFAREKLNWAGTDTLLIDDKERNCQQWASKGGAFILHTDTPSTIEQLKLFGFDHNE